MTDDTSLYPIEPPDSYPWGLEEVGAALITFVLGGVLIIRAVKKHYGL